MINLIILLHGIISPTLKEKIENDMREKFDYGSNILNKIDWETKNTEYLIYAMLNKSFTFETPFIELKNDFFGNSQNKVKYFGLNNTAIEKTFEQVTVLFYNSDIDFAVKIDTVEGEELILYKIDNITNFQDTYLELRQKSNSFTGRKTMLNEKDELRIPYISVNAVINYDEICNKTIKNSNRTSIKSAIQTVDFSLNKYGGNLTSEAYVDIYAKLDSSELPRYFNFTDTFVLYLKENDKDLPYFALLIDNTDVLVNSNI